jgi:ABC-2 type transport system permease protein
VAGTVFRKTLRDLRRSVVGWGLGLAILVWTMAALWPSIRGFEDLDRFLANYPEAMRELFAIESITTGAGFLNAELYTLLLPALFLVYGIGRGARLVAGEERDGTLDVLVVTPLSRTRLLVEKVAALAVALLLLGVVLLLATLSGSAAAEMGVTLGEATVGAASMVLLGLLFGAFAAAIGAATGDRSRAVAVTSAVAVASYVLHVAGTFVDTIAPWRRLSPFTQSVVNGPLGGSLPLGALGLLGAAVTCVAVAAPLFDHRDIRTP